MPKKNTSKPKREAITDSAVLDVHGIAALLTVSADTVYDLLASGELPGRKVGRKWISTRAAVLRWIEKTSGTDSEARAIKGGDKDALVRALNKGTARIRAKGGGA